MILHTLGGSLLRNPESDVKYKIPKNHNTMKTKMKTRFRLKAIFFFGEELLYPTKRYLHNSNIRLFYLVTWYLHLGTTTT